MNIHEHQAKKILQNFGAHIAPGVAITDIKEAKTAIESLPGPVWVVKSQIHAGGRGKGKFKELGPEAEGGVGEGVGQGQERPGQATRGEDRLLCA